MVGQRGFTVIELMIAFVMVGVIMTVAHTADSGQLRHVADSFAEMKAGRIASGRLAELRAADSLPVMGARAFSISPRAGKGLPDVSGEQEIRQLEVGLYEAVVRVQWKPPGAKRYRRVALTTLFEWPSPQPERDK